MNVTITKQNITVHEGGSLTLQCQVNFKEEPYVDIFWLFNGSRKQTNSKYEVNDEWLERSKGSINRKKISLTIHNAGLNDSGQYTCVLNTSHGFRLKNVSVHVVAGANSKFISLLID